VKAGSSGREARGAPILKTEASVSDLPEPLLNSPGLLFGMPSVSHVVLVRGKKPLRVELRAYRKLAVKTGGSVVALLTVGAGE
jgi:hypothetical protein